jgi:hypothetical protein
MEIKYNKRSALFAGASTLVTGFLLVYVSLLVLTFGSSIISGLLVSLIFLKVGVVGFILLVLLVILNVNISKLLLLAITVVTNVLSETIQGVILGSGKSDSIGDTIIVRHHEVENALIEFGDIVWIVIVSSALLAMFFWFLRKNKQLA